MRRERMVTQSKILRKRDKTLGLAPGTPVYVGDKKEEKVKISIFEYDEKDVKELEVKSIDDYIPSKNTTATIWIDIDGIHKIDMIEKVARQFSFHPLILEDIVNTEQRPKMEDFDQNIFLVLKMLDYDDEKESIKIEQVSLVLGKNYVISFLEQEGDVFASIKNRIRKGKGRIRDMKADYLAYSLLDAVVDQYFLILDKLGGKVESLEEKVVAHPHPEVLQEIHRLKREIILLRRSIWPLRELVNTLERSGHPLIEKATRVFLRDIYDLTIQVIDTVETFREMISSMHDTYLSSVSNKMNEIMKVLTIIATIFIPLTFIAGIFGMNFQFMPELTWKWGYYSVLGILFIVALIMVIVFKRKKWL
jgi:magnesium transporter